MVLYIHTRVSQEPSAPLAIFVVQTDIPQHVLDRFPDSKRRPIGTLKDAYLYSSDEKKEEGTKIPLHESFFILSWPVIVEAYHQEVEEEDQWIPADLDVAYQETEHEQRLRIGYGPSPICFGRILRMEEVPSELIPPSVQLRREEQISELPNSELLEHEGESEQEPDTADEVTDPDAQEDSKDRISVIEMLAEHASRPGSNHDVHDVDRGWEAPNEQDATVAQGVPKDGGA